MSPQIRCGGTAPVEIGRRHPCAACGHDLRKGLSAYRRTYYLRRGSRGQGALLGTYHRDVCLECEVAGEPDDLGRHL